MARKSAAALAVVQGGKPGGRIPSPADLSSAEADLWNRITETKPADWFDADSVPVLKEYVRAAVTSDQLAEAVSRALDSDDLVEAAQADKLLLARDRESRRVATLATKLRLTQQSRYTPQSAATANRRASGKRPWEK